MNERRWLTLSLAALAVLAAGAFAAVALSSLTPSAKTQAERPNFETHGLLPGQFRYETVYPEQLSHNKSGADVLLVRLPDGQLRAWWVLVSQGQHRLPDVHWWRVGVPCPVFGPDTEQRVMRCLHGNLTDYFKVHHRWDFDGKALSIQVTDMLAVPGCELDGRFVMWAQPFECRSARVAAWRF